MIRHTNILIPSILRVVQLAIEVEHRFIQVCSLYQRNRGVPIVPPSSLNKDMMEWRQMMVRHKMGDLRHTEVEIKSMESVMEWVTNVKAELCNQPKPIIKKR